MSAYQKWTQYTDSELKKWKLEDKKSIRLESQENKK